MITLVISRDTLPSYSFVPEILQFLTCYVTVTLPPGIVFLEANMLAIWSGDKVHIGQ